MNEEEDERFAAALRGESAEPALGRRLGELLRDQQDRAADAGDEISRRRVWQRIAAHIGGEKPGAVAGWPRRVALAQAAVLAIAGVALGYFLGSSQPQTAESRLEFSYGDLELSRGSLFETVVAADDPLEAMRPLTDALIADRIAFEVYSVEGGADRRVLLTLPASIPPTTAAALRASAVNAKAGTTHAILFAKRGAPSE